MGRSMWFLSVNQYSGLPHKIDLAIKVGNNLAHVKNLLYHIVGVFPYYNLLLTQLP